MNRTQVKNKPHAERNTLAKLYLITQGQFEDLHAQECNKGTALQLDFTLAEKQGYIDAFPQKWYGRILYLGRHKNHPIFTFTNINDLTELNPPAPNYFQSLVKGLRSNYAISNAELLQYFASKPGISGRLAKSTLQDWLLTSG